MNPTMSLDLSGGIERPGAGVLEDWTSHGDPSLVGPLNDPLRRVYPAFVWAQKFMLLFGAWVTLSYLFANDLNTPRRFEQLADRLSLRGHSDDRIEKILGANLLRVFGAAWDS